MSHELKVVAPAEPAGLAVRNLDDVLRFSELLAKSKLIPVHLQSKPQDVAIILMKGHELRLAPLQAIDSIDVIQGKPSLKPEAQLALIYAAFPQALINVEQDTKAISVRVTVTRPGNPTPQVFFWDMAKARQMGLDKKDNYIKQPLVMLKWRAIGEMARTVFPDVTRGLYNTEEAEDLVRESGTDKGARLSAALSDEPREVASTVEPSPRAERAKAELDKTTATLSAKAPEIETPTTAPITEAEASQLVNGDDSFDSFFGGPLAKDDDSDPVIKIGKLYLGKRMSQVPTKELAGAYEGIKKLRAAQPLTPEQTDFIKDYEYYTHNHADKRI